MIKQQELWAIPEWMKPYTKYIAENETLEYIEEMVNDNSTIHYNAPKALISVEICGRIQMLSTLHAEGLLRSNIKK